MSLARPLPALPTSERWRLDASCRSIEPSLFFPIGVTRQAHDQIGAAKQICATCPVTRPSLEFAIATNQDNGVWGGTSEEERRALRRKWLRSRRTATA
jgi:WhiB family redox-sensing transcriptional regulator